MFYAQLGVMCWKNRIQCLVNQFILPNGPTKPIFLSVRGQGINNSWHTWPLLLMEINILYGLLVWTMLPIENIKLSDILIGVTWSIIASQLLRASWDVSLADEIQQHPASDAYGRKGTHNSPVATQPSQDPVLTTFRDHLYYPIYVQISQVFSFIQFWRLEFSMHISVIPFKFVMNGSNTECFRKTKCVKGNICTQTRCN